MGKSRVMGNTDKPIMNCKNDEFQIAPYVNGLSEFIKECETPMTVAIQGDWGCGKTSMMNMVKDYLAQNSEIITVWFNTWQFSQFNMDDKLAITFLQHLTKKLVDKLPQQSEKNAIVSKMKPIMKSIAVGMTKHFAGSEIGDMVDSVMSEVSEEQAEATDVADRILQLKDNFEQLIKKVAKSEEARVVIFIDDLDRLQPIRAVELLEVLKLFVDCEKCVFVMAIDTSVVFQGIREKYGKDMSDEKAQSFFDKMIQLPFKMPVAYYKLDKMMGRLMDFLQDDVMEEKERENFITVIRQVTGGNPRTLKRLANSILLVDKVALQRGMYEEEDAKVQSFIRRILATLACIQLKYEPAYAFIVNNLKYGHMKDILDLKFIGREGTDRGLKLIKDMEEIGMSGFAVTDETFFYNLMHLFVEISNDLIQRIINSGETPASAIKKLIQIISLNNIKDGMDENSSQSQVVFSTEKEETGNIIHTEEMGESDAGAANILSPGQQAMVYTGMLYAGRAMEAYRLLEERRIYPNIKNMNWASTGNEELKEFRDKQFKITETYLGGKIDSAINAMKNAFKQEIKTDGDNSILRYYLTWHEEFSVILSEDLKNHYIVFSLSKKISSDMKIFERSRRLLDEVEKEYKKLNENYGEHIFPKKAMGKDEKRNEEGELVEIKSISVPVVNEVISDLIVDFLDDIARNPECVLSVSREDRGAREERVAQEYINNASNTMMGD